MQADSERRAILMVWDGLRPDMIAPERTPVLARLAAEGVRFTDSHAVFPTVTRCNSASIATGALPGGHGIPGNTFYAPALDPAKALATSDVTHLYALTRARGGRLLQRPALADRIHAAAGRSVVVSTGSTGSAFLQHPNSGACDGWLCNPNLWIGVQRETVEGRIGPMPPGSLPNTEQNAWFTRLIGEVVLPDLQPRLIAFWHTDPDRTQHDRGVGHPETLCSIRDADSNLGALLDALDRLDLRGVTDIVITSDHGFSTISGNVDVAAALVRAGLKESKESTDVVVTGGAVYAPGADAARIEAIARVLQETEGVANVFHHPRHALPETAGTLPLALTGGGGDLAPDLLFSPDWRDDANEHGFPGVAWSGPSEKTATHGSISPWDIRNTLVAAGPSFKRGLVSDVPAGNTDIAPTLARTLGLPAADGYDGRVLAEALVDGPDPAAVRVERETHRGGRGGYQQEVRVARVDGAQYLDFGRVERS